jgi:hypothetical protein
MGAGGSVGLAVIQSSCYFIEAKNIHRVKILYYDINTSG